MEYMMLIVLIVLMGVMMFYSSRKAKKQQQERQAFRTSLAPGTEVITIGGLIGKVVVVDELYEEIVLDSEGSLLRFSLQSVSRAYVRPAYVSDDDVDENGNPLPKDEPAQITSNEPESDGSETVVEETSVVETPEDADSSPFETQSK